MEVDCDKCKQAFKIELQEKKSGKLKKLFFVCPHCKKKYPVATVPNK